MALLMNLKFFVKENGRWAWRYQKGYRIHENLISAKQNMKTLTDKITKEVLAGRVAGLFQSPPFTNTCI